MIIVLGSDATDAQLQSVQERLAAVGYATHVSRGEERTVVGVVGDTRVDKAQLMEQISLLPGVEQVVPILKPYKIADRRFRAAPTVIDVGGVPIGGPSLVVVAGPCSVESEEQLMQTALAVKANGGQMLRGGAFKPRTNPYGFQGLAEEGLRILAAARAETGLKIVTEVLDPRHVELVGSYTDIFQIGARNMQNFQLLREVGRAGKPAMLKRGLCATYDEWLQAADYLLNEGNGQVMLCERGIRGFDSSHTRNVLDLAAVAVMRELTHLPIVVDPSHGVGHARYVTPMAKAAVAAGAHALIVEVHPNPSVALTDGPQSLDLSQFARLMAEIGPLAAFMDRPLFTAPSRETVAA
jgi:3-deoxy-7-phosphoheptulonate synthase